MKLIIIEVAGNWLTKDTKWFLFLWQLHQIIEFDLLPANIKTIQLTGNKRVKINLTSPISKKVGCYLKEKKSSSGCHFKDFMWLQILSVCKVYYSDSFLYWNLKNYIKRQLPCDSWNHLDEWRFIICSLLVSLLWKKDLSKKQQFTLKTSILNDSD